MSLEQDKRFNVKDTVEYKGLLYIVRGQTVFEKRGSHQ